MPKICTPAMLYLVFSILTMILIIYQGLSPGSAIVKGLFVLAWTWFLNFLCLKGHTTISWFLVLLPFLLMLAMFAMAMEVATSVVKKEPTKTQNAQPTMARSNF